MVVSLLVHTYFTASLLLPPPHSAYVDTAIFIDGLENILSQTAVALYLFSLAASGQ